ncbi:MAG: hypothetical protein ACFFBD_24400 [Candidatus Hodarchaeota archaeon]
MVKSLERAKKLILLFLKDLGEATTKELIEEAEELGIAECRDRIPSAIADLNDEGLLVKQLSKEKKAVVWKLSNSVDVSSLE